MLQVPLVSMSKDPNEVNAAVKNACDSPGQTKRWLGTEVARVRARERKGAGYA